MSGSLSSNQPNPPLQDGDGDSTMSLEAGDARKRPLEATEPSRAVKRHRDLFDGAEPGLWTIARGAGTICHTFECAPCDQFGLHVRDSMVNGELAQIMDVAAEAHRQAHFEQLIPRRTIAQWRAACPPLDDFPTVSGRPRITAASVLAYTRAVLPADLFMSELVYRPKNSPSTTSVTQLRARRHREHAAALLLALCDVAKRIDNAAIPGWFATLSPETPDVVMNVFPRRFFWIGDASDVKYRLYPVVKRLHMPWGNTIDCVLPSRPIGLFEMARISPNQSGVLLSGPGGHPHFPFGAWLAIPRFEGGCRTAPHVQWHVPIVGSNDYVATLLALAIPWISRDETQRQCIVEHGRAFVNAFGSDAWDEFRRAAGAADFGEQQLAVAENCLDTVPQAIRLIVEDGVAHWDEFALQAYCFMQYVFGARAESAIRALNNGPFTSSERARVFEAADYHPEREISPAAVYDHMVRMCGLSDDDMQIFFDLARDWVSPEAIGRNLTERQRWRAILHSNPEPPPIPTKLARRANDPQMDDVDAAWAAKRYMAPRPPHGNAHSRSSGSAPSRPHSTQASISPSPSRAHSRAPSTTREDSRSQYSGRF